MPFGWEIAPAVAFAVVMIWEILAPARSGDGPDGRRWFCNFSLFAVNTAVLSAISYALAALSEWPSLTSLLTRGEVTAGGGVAVMTVWSLLLLDLSTFAAHRLCHVVPLFWRFHEVHHSDVDVDATTSVRHHALEAILTFVIVGVTAKLAAIPSAYFAVYGSIAMAVQAFQHGNVYVPKRAARVLGILFVTPDLHQIHHRQDHKLANRNFGTLLNVWDRMFGTFHFPRAEDTGPFGSAGIAPARSRKPWTLLWSPLRVRA